MFQFLTISFSNNNNKNELISVSNVNFVGDKEHLQNSKQLNQLIME